MVGHVLANAGLGASQDLGDDRRDGHLVSQAIVLRLLRVEGLLLSSTYTK